MKIKKKYLVITVLCILLIFFMGCSKSKKSSGLPELIVTFLDVGQGDASLITLPNRQYILIDSGDGANPYKEDDAGRDIIAPYLKDKGIDYIDYLIQTHPHRDHMGGSQEILYEIQVGEVFINGRTSGSRYYKRVLEYLRDKDVPVKKVVRGDSLKFEDIKELEIEFLHPDNVDKYDNINNGSIVTYLSYGNIVFLIMADAEEEAEESILKDYENLQANILRIGHHGSRTSSSPKFINTVKPEVGIISCAEKNKFGHPSRNTIKKYESINTKLYRTYLNGNITVYTDGKTYRIETDK